MYLQESAKSPNFFGEIFLASLIYETKHSPMKSQIWEICQRMWMYLAALVRQAWHVSTYFTAALGVVGGGGSPINRNTTLFCYGQKMTGQKMSTKKWAVRICPDYYCPKHSANSSAIPSGMASSSSAVSAKRASAIALTLAWYALVSALLFLERSGFTAGAKINSVAPQ